MATIRAVKHSQQQLLNASNKALSELFLLLRTNNPDPCADIWRKADKGARSSWLALAGAPANCLDYQYEQWISLPAFVRGQLARALAMMIEFFTIVGLH